MRLKKLGLFQITAFQKEAELDFSKIPPGVIAITAENGAGKTTTLEATGPGSLFRELPTRLPKNLSNWLKYDGRLDLHFDIGPHECLIRHRYRKSQGPTASIQIDGVWSDGKAGSFDERIERLIGPKSAFYAGPFAMQTGDGRFASLAKRDRRDLFRFFLGLDEVTAASRRVGEWAAGIDLHALQRAKDRAADESKDLRAARKEMDQAEAAEGKARSELEGLGDAIDNALRWWKAHARMENLARLKKSIADVVDVDEDEAEAALGEHTAKIKEIESWEAELERLTDSLEDAGKRAALIDTVPCGAEGDCAACPFLEEAVRAKGGIPDLVLEGADLTEKLEASDKGLHLRLKRAAEAQLSEAARARKMRSLIEEVADLEADARRAWSEAKAGGSRTHDDPGVLKAREKALQRELDQAVRDHALKREKVERLKKSVASLQRKIRKLLSLEEDYEALGFLTRALSPTGIPAMELEAAGPVVSAIANDLLAHCYGDRFSITIRTVAPKAATGGLKEVVDVVVQDSARGREGAIETFSGGEQVIIDEAIRTAISLYGVEHGAWNFPIETMWRDETPAALYGANIDRYVMMLQRARTIGGFHHVIFVGSEQAARAADTVVRIKDGAFHVE